MLRNLVFVLFLYNEIQTIKCAPKSTPVLELPQGKLRGLESQRGHYRKYLGIPYATFNGRFLDPGPPPIWSDVFNATENKASCPQYFERLGIPLGTEDCLTLNVFTPGQISFKKLLPVMFFIHGGGYTTGSANELLYNPELLVMKNIIVVVINYRIGAFGFLCLRIKGASGNAGLKDQAAALQWVNQNIKHFGGDPQLVTIFGQSAGAASVNFLMFSRELKGLFQRAIMESGTALSPLALVYDPIERASLVASKMGYSTKNPYDLLKIFRNATVTDIILASVTNKTVNPLSTFIFRPCIERLLIGEKPILTKSPKQILESGNYNQVPVIIGYNNREGLFHVQNYEESWYQDLDDNFEDSLPRNLIFSSPDDQTSIGHTLRRFYFKDFPIDKDVVDNITDYFSDSVFHYSSEAVTQHLLQTSKFPVFNYYFQYDSNRNQRKVASGLENLKGAAHFDELFYLFQPVAALPLPKNKKDMTMMDRMSTMWSNFAKSGDPTSVRTPVSPSKWQASINGSIRFLIIDESLRMAPTPNARRIEFWRSIYSSYGYP